MAGSSRSSETSPLTSSPSDEGNPKILAAAAAADHLHELESGVRTATAEAIAAKKDASAAAAQKIAAVLLERKN